MDPQKINFSSMWKLYIFEERCFQKQNTSFHLDAQRYSLKLKEISCNDFVSKTKPGDPSHRSTYDAVIAKIRNFNYDKLKFRLLRQLFLRYLKVRCPFHNLIQNESLVYFVGSLISLFSLEGDKDFEPEILWLLMKKINFIKNHSIFFSIEFTIMNKFGLDIRDRKNFANKMYTSLFGEFIYYISVKHEDRESPLTLIKKYADESEYSLLQEISVKVSPKLGILIFIVFRNSANYYFNHLVNGMLTRHSKKLIEIYPTIRHFYLKSVAMIETIPVVDKYFEMFLNYYIKELNEPSRYFEKHNINVKSLKTLQNIVNDEMSYLHILVFILRSVADMFLFMYQEKGDVNFKIFGELPTYLDRHPLLKNVNCRNILDFLRNGHLEKVKLILMAMSALTDFLFIENWQGDIVDDYVHICKNIKVVLESRYYIFKQIVGEAALFPFM